MRLSLYSSFLLASLTTAFASEGAPSDVLDLNASNFESVVNPADLILVEFFAPWCGHCKALAPHYEEAATKLKEKNIPIAKVDCVEQAELCQTHGVGGYPTLKVFRKGTPTDYNGPRKADGIISYMVKQSLPAITTVTADSHAEFIKADKVVVVLYATSTSEAPAPNFSKTAEKHRDDFLFGIVTDPAVAQAADVSPPALVVYKSFDDGRSDFPAGQVSSLDEAKLGAWLKEHSTPLIDEISGENYNTYAESGLPLAYIFVDPAVEGNDAFIDGFKPLAKEYKGKINFVWIDGIKFGEHAKLMNLQDTNWPSFVIQEIDKQLKYPFDQRAWTTPSSIASFVKEYAAGNLEPSLRSAPFPEAQDEPVFVLVTKQFDDVVYDDKKDVFVEFYAPWCGHCKRLKPTWDSLGEKYADLRQKITIAKMDATENDIPPSAPFRVNGFPTIKFKPAGSREFIDYEGDRSLESLVEFVETHAKNDLTPPASTGTPSSSSVIAEKTPEAHDHEEQAHIEL